MAQYLSERHKPTWEFLPNLSPEENVKVLLAKMACFRQAVLEGETLELFTSYLLPLDLRAFQVAMANLAESERQEGETAFPSMGTILAQMDSAREFFPRLGEKTVDTQPLFSESRAIKRLK